MPQNCWEVKQCGREPDGAKTLERGVCPAAAEARTNGINRGKNGGRCCWAVAGTLCGGKRQGIFAQKLSNCMKRDFYLPVMNEEGSGAAKKTAEILRMLQKEQALRSLHKVDGARAFAQS